MHATGPSLLCVHTHYAHSYKDFQRQGDGAPSCGEDVCQETVVGTPWWVTVAAESQEALNQDRKLRLFFIVLLESWSKFMVFVYSLLMDSLIDKMLHDD